MRQKTKYTNLLNLVEKPSRYIGSEWNAATYKTKKNPLRIVLAFPDKYELGTSHLGLRILYSHLNAVPNIAAERVFAPARDYSEKLTEHKIPLLSLETHTPLKKFDVIGFSLQYELGYTNLLNMLNLSRIALRSSDRKKHDPFILAGGPCVFNPEPMAMFIDAFLIGDGEIAITEVCQKIALGRKNKLSRTEILKSLSEIEGIYVPSLYEEAIEPVTGMIYIKKGIAPYPIKRRIEFDLDKLSYPYSFPVPYCESVHDRISIEISRGCNAGCRFCQAGIIYRPNRIRNPNSLLEIIEKSLSSTGFDEVSLASLDVSSYPCLGDTIDSLMKKFEQKRISLALPSVRADAITEQIAEAIKSVRKTGFTIAPEAGTQRLRNAINKGISEEDILNSVSFAFKHGWQRLKLYFMIGLPTETMEDIDAIFELSKTVAEIGKKISHKSGNVNVAISTFVPKPHTPFQWFPVNDQAEIKTKQLHLLDRIKRHRNIKLKWHDSKITFLEAIMSRGDRKIGYVIESAYKSGAMFDGWTDELRFDLWEDALKKHNIDPADYLYKQFPLDVKLPWSHIDTRVNPDFLRSELEKSKIQALTPMCGKNNCYGCGVCSKEFLRKDIPEMKASPSLNPKENNDDFFCYSGYFKKTGLLRFLSHREVFRNIQKTLRKADIPMHYSAGFNPHPKISFGPALPVGMEGLKEPIRFEIEENIDSTVLKNRINAQFPNEFKLVDLFRLPKDSEKMHTLYQIAMYKVPHSFTDSQQKMWQGKIVSVMKRKTISFTKITKGSRLKKTNMRNGIIDIKILKRSVKFSLDITTRPKDVITQIFKNKLDSSCLVRLGFKKNAINRNRP